MAVYLNPRNLRIVGMTNHTHNKYKTVMEMMLRHKDTFTCSAIGSRRSRQSWPWRPAWPVKAWRSLLTRGWSKQHVSVPLVRLPCGWKNRGARGFHPSSWICTIKSVACQTDTAQFCHKENPEHTAWNSAVCFGFIGRRQAWRSVDFCCRKGKVLLKLKQGPIGFQ